VSQNFHDLEVLLVDGGSTDETVEIIKEYANRHPTIKWASERDKGIYDAMNKGLKTSKGEWIYFLGSDDSFYNENVLQNIYDFYLENKTLDVIYGKVCSERFRGIYGEEYIGRKLLKNNICHQAIFFNKKVFEVVGHFNLKYTSQADWDHNLKWFLNTRIEKKFADIVIANYADGGYSSVHGDIKFYRDLRLNYILYGHDNLLFRQKLSILCYELLKSMKRGDVVKIKKVLSYFRYLF
jgi:glycosyltransferase involved in cell wall biosynthesis